MPLSEERECRNCHCSGGDDLIAPCACSGSIKYVHRSCLNSWRAVSPNERSFTNCDVCGFKYRFKEREDLRAGRVKRFVFYVARDITGAMLLVQCVIVLLSLAIWGIDSKTEGAFRIFPQTWSLLAVYYVWGLFFFSICAAIYGAMLGLYMCCASSTSAKSTYSHNSYPYAWGYYYWWWGPYPGTYSGCCPVCDCSGGCCSGHCCTGCGGGSSCGDSHGDNSGMGMAAIIVLVVGIVIGFIVMVVIATLILRTHIKILRKVQDAREMEVVDLENGEDHNHSEDPGAPLMV